jgi:hypothetical protein
LVDFAHFNKDRGEIYINGVATYYKKLFKQVRKRYPEAKFIMEPPDVYNKWIKTIIDRDDRAEIMPDVLCQEIFGDNFITDSRIFQSKLIERKNVMCTSPNSFLELDNRNVAVQAALHGQIYSWYGRFGGTGNVPNYKSIKEVPPRLKLIKQLSLWEELNQTPLNERQLIDGKYSSPTAFVSNQVIAVRHPSENILYVVVLQDGRDILLDYRFPVTEVFDTDDLFMKTNNSIYISVKNNQLHINSDLAINKGFICRLSEEK